MFSPKTDPVVYLLNGTHGPEEPEDGLQWLRGPVAPPSDGFQPLIAHPPPAGASLPFFQVPGEQGSALSSWNVDGPFGGKQKIRSFWANLRKRKFRRFPFEHTDHQCD